LRKYRLAATALGAAALLALQPGTGVIAAPSAAQLSGTGAPLTGAFTPSDGLVTDSEFPDMADGGATTGFTGTIGVRSLSRHGNQNDNQQGPDERDHERGRSAPEFQFGFEGLNHYQQRFARGGNQFSLVPPDQGLCVGNGFVVEAVNDALNIFNSSGLSVLPDNTATNIVAGLPRNVNHAVDLNSFYHYAPAINRATGVRGPEITDPTCLYDAATQRFFLVVLTLDVNPATNALSLVNHLDIAVSQTADPTGVWNIYKLDVTNDGTSNPDPANKCPCIGDYPHIGADANGFYITTNAYPFKFGQTGFNGAQIYALSKAQLAAGAASVTVVHIDTFGAVREPSEAGNRQPGFTLWPAQSPGTDSFERSAHGTEYFLSSNAADEATRPITGNPGPRTSNQLVVWALTNTRSLNSASPNLHLTNRVVRVGRYAVPPSAKQPGSGTLATQATPLGFCVNNTTTVLFNGQTGCWRLLVGAEPAHDERISRPDANDSRMQQVMFANGKLWGALDTALTIHGTNRAGIEWFIVRPDADDDERVEADLQLQGYLGAAGLDFTYPAIGVTARGRGVMAFSAMGDALNPSAAYASIDARNGVGQWTVVPGGQGAGPDDGFSAYKALVAPDPIRPRWGDYGAAAVDGNSIWIASEYIAHACDYLKWGGPFFAGGSGDNILGTCAASAGAPGTRSSFANWSTRISHLTVGR
jgi:hypothetical protein